jgi:serine protease Do
MGNFLSAFSAAMVVGVVSGNLPGPATAQSVPEKSFAVIVESVMPSVVGITSKGMMDPSDDEASRAQSNAPFMVDLFGSGVIADETGLIVTNKHLIDRAYQIEVRLHDGTMAKARLLGTALSGIDLAVIKIDVGYRLTAARFGDSNEVQVGDRVLAVGNPLGWSASVTSGIVRSLGRDLRQTAIGEFIQTDAIVDQGNSGGPVFNMEREVIGISSQRYSDIPSGGSTAVGFALPVNDVRFLLEQINAFGRPHYGYIGAWVQGITPAMADAIGLPTDTGVIVGSLTSDGPAAVAGIKPGDVLLRINGQKTTDYRNFHRTIAISPGKAVMLEVWNGGQTRSVTVDVKEYPQSLWASYTSDQVKAPRFSQVTDFGFELSDVTPALRGQYSLSSDLVGPVVTRVISESAASSAGFKVGDVLVDAQGTKLSAVSDFMNRLMELRDSGRRNVMLYVGGTGGDRWVALPLQL